ncbi:MAG: VanR-ABDEGLN family response regulator transcription factor [Lachnospiraceae bacterium]|jgi:two-component system response regulator VanR|nr:VanR-ABDEGLN family response regulator transcription factor [Lachnospiraceae bacterium]
MAGHILVVDDEVEVADLLELYLGNEGYQVYKFYQGKEALECVEKQQVDLALLDVMLPDMDGFHICRMIRKSHYFPIIMLTARVEDVDKINGLMLGADDYITKPFNPLEVVARVKTQLRRYRSYNSQGNEGPGAGEAAGELDIRGLWMSQRTHQSTLFGKKLDLTPREFSILWYLGTHQGQVVSSEELFEAVWKEKYLDNNNTVMAHIGRIREKMQDSYRNQKFIKTVWGVGYTIEK